MTGGATAADEFSMPQESNRHDNDAHTRYS